MTSEATTNRRPLRKVVVVFKTHFDLGFTGLPHEVMQQYTGTMFEAVRAVMLATGGEPERLRYNWTLPAWPLKFLLHDPSVPAETREQARKLVEEGRLHWHAWPFTTHTAFCGLEELVRGLHISRGLSEEFGRWPTGAKQTDVPGHTWALPSLLHGARVRFLHLGCNSGSHAPHVPRLFWWEGPDGSRLLTYYSPGGYGTPPLPPDDWPFDTWLALQQTVDNHGPQSPEDLLRLRRMVKQGAPGAELVFGQLGDFYESLMEQPEQLDDLPVVQCDLADTWIHGIGTMPREVARVRELRFKLQALEGAAAALDLEAGEVLSGEGERDFPTARRVAPLIDGAYEQLLLFGEHTWGLDVKSTIKRAFGDEFEAARATEPYRRLEASWAAKGWYVDRAEALYEQALFVVGEAIPPADRHKVTMGSVTVDLEEVAERAANRSNAPMPGPEPGEPECVLEDHLYRVEVDPALGGIVSLLDKQTGYEWVDRDNIEPFAGYRYDIHSAADIAEFMRAYGLYFQDWFVQDFGKAGYPEDQPHVTAYARDFTLSNRDEKGQHCLVMTGGRLVPATGAGGAQLPAQQITIKVGLSYSSYEMVGLEYTVTGKQATPLAESTVVPFPLNLPRAGFRIGQTGSVIDPTRDIAEGANRFLWCVDEWLDASDDRVGLSIRPVDMPLVSIGDAGIYRFDPHRRPAGSAVYSHLSNTQWGTNFPQWLEGSFRWRIDLRPHARDWRDGFAGARNPRILQYASVLPPVMMSTARLLALTRQDLVTIAVRPRHDGHGLIMRLAERWGYPREEVLYFSSYLPEAAYKRISSVWLCDTMERPIEKLEYHMDGWPHGLKLKVGAFSVITLLVEFKGGGSSDG